MVEALVRIVADDAERRRMGATAYERTRRRYSWPALAKRVAAVYGDVADAGPTLTKP
jgi:glycosyltransferase involved in cell wall biosynthesis